MEEYNQEIVMEMTLAVRKVKVRSLIIKRKRIRNPEKYLHSFENGKQVRIAVKVDDIVKNIAKDIGFGDEFTLGESILPDASLSKAAFENSEGKCIVRKDLPMEKAERYWEWSWEDWGGNLHSDSTYIPYYRYVREYFKPKAFEIAIGKDEKDELWITSSALEVNPDNYDDIKLLINLFLSIFHCCEIVNENLTVPLPHTKRLDWEILRPGKHSWMDVDRSIDKIIDSNVSESKRSMFKRNIDILRQKAPDIIAIGKNGFNGYIVFNYPKLKMAILESLMPNNATYILNEDWEEVSQFTKTQVLTNSLHKARIYHYQNWENQIREYLGADSKIA